MGRPNLSVVVFGPFLFNLLLRSAGGFLSASFFLAFLANLLYGELLLLSVERDGFAFPFLSSFILPLAVVGGTLLAARAPGSSHITPLK